MGHRRERLCRFGPRPADYERQAEANQRYADIAASVQLVMEETLLTMARAALDALVIDKLILHKPL